MARIGFVGLGNMGLPMAINLLKAGHEVMGFDREQAPMQALKHAGGRLASTLHEAALNQDVVITMLQTGEQVESVCFVKAISKCHLFSKFKMSPFSFF